MRASRVLLGLGLPFIGLLGLGVGVASIAATERRAELGQLLLDPYVKPFPSAVAGIGTVEPNTQAIAVASPLGGIIERLHVHVGETVERGAALFDLDRRSLQARVDQADAALSAARAATRVAERQIALQDAIVDQMRAGLTSASADDDRVRLELDRYSALAGGGWTSQQRLEAAVAEAKKGGANRLRADASLAEARQRREVLAAQHQQAEAEARRAGAELDAARVDLDRATVRAPIAGLVLKVDVRAGEYVLPGQATSPMVLGNVEPLHLRVEVDEHDAARVSPTAAAVARLRGSDAPPVRLTFVRFEPMLRPKTKLLNVPGEQVDTRVLQVVYAADPAALSAYVGQLADVFIEQDAALSPIPVRPTRSPEAAPALSETPGLTNKSSAAADP